MEIDEKRIEKIEKLLEENNKMLKQVRSVQKRAWWAMILKWTIFVALSFGAYYAIQPYVERVNSGYGQMLNAFGNAQNGAANISAFFGQNTESNE
ncbi:MAG: hypothetical protein KBC22_01020 [Candidatus Pacebacteria bacterium]|nr:hypothetical protein [Candidatus Paceibacterota bacterium]